MGPTTLEGDIHNLKALSERVRGLKPHLEIIKSQTKYTVESIDFILAQIDILTAEKELEKGG